MSEKSTMTDTFNLPEGHRELHRLVMPLGASPETTPLYVESQAHVTPVEMAGGSPGGFAEALASASSPVNADASADAYSRTGLTIPARRMRSFGTYFNAFPASYWRRWTPVREVTLTIETKGEGTLVVNRSNAKGRSQRVASRAVSGGETSTFVLPLTAFGDGGWYWFDAYAGKDEFEVQGAVYSAPDSLARARGSFSIAMTTMNKVSYCFENIRTIADSPRLLETLDTMFIVDQGSDRLRDHTEELAELEAAMGGKLRIIEQGNIGGSGGFSRGMYEASMAGESTYVVNCDDDIVIEPVSLERLVTFADFATKPTIVGAHMFDLNNRTSLHTFGEIVDRWRIQPALPHQEMSLSYDLGTHPLRATPWLHRRVDVDYNGWWMCLIPTEVVREIGLSLPVFIKWDDAEYGLRAKNAGYSTVSLPGAGVWHVAWGDKDDLVGWQAFFHERNRLITALLHSPYERGGRLVKESHFMDIKHVISMQYYTQTGRIMAQRDVLAGPEHLHETIGTTLPEIRALAAQFDDAVQKKDVDDYPDVRTNKPPRKGRGFSQPRRLLMPAWTIKQLAKQAFTKPSELSLEHPQEAIAHQDARWWRLSHYDSALVSNAEGTQIAWYKRDPKQARELLAEAVRTHAELFAKWSTLREQYRAAASQLTSFEAWERTFAANPAPKREGRNA